MTDLRPHLPVDIIPCIADALQTPDTRTFATLSRVDRVLHATLQPRLRRMKALYIASIGLGEIEIYNLSRTYRMIQAVLDPIMQEYAIYHLEQKWVTKYPEAPGAWWLK